jgi:hypothetical protein
MPLIGFASTGEKIENLGLTLSPLGLLALIFFVLA